MMTAEDRWSMDNSFYLCDHGAEKVHEGKVRFFDKRFASSVSDTVRRLNAGELACPEGFCAVFSATRSGYFVLYTSDHKRAVLFDLFDLAGESCELERTEPPESATLGPNIWSTQLSEPLCSAGEEAPFIGKFMFLDRSSERSVTAAVQRLNEGTIQCPNGFCAVFSERGGQWYLLYKPRARAEALKRIQVAMSNSLGGTGGPPPLLDARAGEADTKATVEKAAEESDTKTSAEPAPAHAERIADGGGPAATPAESPGLKPSPPTVAPADPQYRVSIRGRENTVTGATYYTVVTASDSEEWIAKRRYCEFDLLTRDLSRAGILLPEMPPKSVVMRRVSLMFKEERQCALEAILCAGVGSDPTLRSLPQLREFLGVPKKPT